MGQKNPSKKGGLDILQNCESYLIIIPKRLMDAFLKAGKPQMSGGAA
jgi:hypothetical protein